MERGSNQSFRKGWLAVLVAPVLLAAMPQDRPVGKLTNKVPHVAFRVQGNLNSKTEFVLVPILPTSIYGIISGNEVDPPKIGDIFQCTAGTKSLGLLKNEGQATASILVLECGKVTFFIEGIQFTPE